MSTETWTPVGLTSETWTPADDTPPVAPPVNLTPPTIAGIPSVGEVLMVVPGTYTGSPTLTYQWNRAGVAILGATSTAYLALDADEGLELTVTETATNAGGVITTTSAGVLISNDLVNGLVFTDPRTSSLLVLIS